MSNIRLPPEILNDGSVVAFLGWLKRVGGSDDTVYRGQPEDKPLLPLIARGNPRVNPRDTERNLFEELRRRLQSVYQGNLADDWERLALAQHYGAPTRLLDWTRNPLAALWFAVSKHARTEVRDSAVVWSLQLTSEDFVDRDQRDREGPFEVSRTVFYEPPHFDGRISAQQGLFSVHKYWEKGTEVVPLEFNRQFKPRLKKLIVPHAFLGSLLNELDRIGVNAASLFPDLSGLGLHLAMKHKLEPQLVSPAGEGTVRALGSATLNVNLGNAKS